MSSSTIPFGVSSFWNLPKDEAVDAAYKILGVRHRSSNGEINKAFRALSLKHHPDKGGDTETFAKINAAMEIIRLERDMK